MDQIQTSNAIKIIAARKSGMPRDIELLSALDYDVWTQRAAKRSEKTIEGTVSSVRKMDAILKANGLPTAIDAINDDTIRFVILQLSTARRYAGHPFIQAQETLLSSGSINDKLRAIRAFINRMETAKIISKSPFDGVAIPSPHYERREVQEEDDIRKLIGVIDPTTPIGCGDLALVTTFVDSGGRLGGLSGITMDRVDLKRGRLVVTEKGGKERIIFFGKTLKPILWQWTKRFRPEPAYPDGDYLFLTVDGRQLTKNRIEAKFRKYAIRAGLDPHKFTPHAMRHFFCTRFIRHGGSVSDLQAISGHADIKSLSIYLHPGLDDLQAAHGRCSPLDHLHLNVRKPMKGGKS